MSKTHQPLNRFHTWKEIFVWKGRCLRIIRFIQVCWCNKLTTPVHMHLQFHNLPGIFMQSTKIDRRPCSSWRHCAICKQRYNSVLHHSFYYMISAFYTFEGRSFLSLYIDVSRDRFCVSSEELKWFQCIQADFGGRQLGRFNWPLKSMFPGLL